MFISKRCRTKILEKKKHKIGHDNVKLIYQVFVIDIETLFLKSNAN